MPWKNAEDRHAAQKQYRATARGKEVHERARAKFVAKRKGEKPVEEAPPQLDSPWDALTLWRHE